MTPSGALFGRDRRVGECLLLREERKSGLRGPISVFDPERPSGLRAACRVLPSARLHRLIVLAGARTRIARLGVPIGLEKETESVTAPAVVAGNGDLDRRLARDEAA